MSKICPKCGLSEPDDARVCHICGAGLVESDDNAYENEFAESLEDGIDAEYDDGDGQEFDDIDEMEADESDGQENDEFEFDFDEKENSSASDVFEGLNSDVAMPTAPTVPIKISDAVANRAVKAVHSMSQALIVICIIRFVYMFINMSDVTDLKEVLPLFEGSIYYAPLDNALNLFYAGAVILALLLVSSVVTYVFAYKMRRTYFPVQDTAVFDMSKKAFYASIASTVVSLVYFVLEVVACVNNAEMGKVFEEEVMTVSEMIISLVFDAWIVAMAVMTLVNSLKIATCKKQ